MNPAIELRAVWRAYREAGGEHAVLTGADASIPRGALCVLLGRSGSGKSTLLNLISGIDRPDRGEIVVAGRNLGSLSERDRTLFRRRHIGFVFQAFNLIPTLNVGENLRLPLELNEIGDRRAQTARVAELLEQIGLGGSAHRAVDTLSGGEQQRIAIARALIHNPEIVLADEPTGNLDLETGVVVLELLDRLTRRAGKTLFMATHSPEVVGVADRILSIVGGRLQQLASEPQGASES